MSERELYRQARLKDLHWYLLALAIIILGFKYTEFFSLPSLIPSSVLGAWAFGIMRLGKIQEGLLVEAKPVIDRLMSEGLSEHDAMLKVGIDKFYYMPFWAVR